jgi:mitochondrial intermediate peptidase
LAYWWREKVSEVDLSSKTPRDFLNLRLKLSRNNDMLKSIKYSRWTCPRCIASYTRSASTVATASSANSTKWTPFTPTTTSNAAYDDKILRQVFDSKKFWNEFSKGSKTSWTSGSSGLVRNKYLTTPEGFLTFAQVSTQRIMAIVKKTLAIDTIEGYKDIVRDLDRTSDYLCRVIDLADFIRSTHPDRKFQMMAAQAYSIMFQYMNMLNTTTGLNDQLEKAIEIPEVYNSWTQEEKTVANILIKDFSKSAIDLPASARKEFVDLSDAILDSGSNFVDHMEPEKPAVHFKAAELKGLNPKFIKSHSRFGIVTIASNSSSAYEIIANAEDPNIRREMFMANRTASSSTIDRLEDMLLNRSRLAKLASYESYAHMALSDKMAQTPEAVNQFLSSLNADNQSVVREELEELLELKKADAYTGNFANRINAWDKDYYVHRLKMLCQTRTTSRDILAQYFSLGTVFQGLSRLFNRVYGIRFVPKETQPGETWHDEVRRLDVIDDSNQLIAVVYCDLFTRAGKTPNPAHFTLRCSRAIHASEIAEYASDDVSPFSDPYSAATCGNAFSHDPATNTLHQLPTIALICDFHPGSPPLLTLHNVQTLFHEMGHALHSILGRTALQNVAGTRCATDLAEVPSVLMEHFALAPQPLALWARHWETDRPLPYELVRHEVDVERGLTKGLETEEQIAMARLDQALHARLWCDEPAGKVPSTEVYHEICAGMSLPDPKGTARQGFFGHLYGYGATYYSYLFARAIAGKVWREVFGGGVKACDREAGERLKGEFLMHGGSRDGWQCVASMLKDGRLERGGEGAMRIVGEWGVKGDNTDVHVH